MMTRCKSLTTLLAISWLAAGTVARAGTIQQGILSASAAAPDTVVPGTVDMGYVTAIFGNVAFFQDATGGIYDVYGAEPASGSFAAGPFNGFTIGTQFTTLSGGGFEVYSKHNQFEYYGTSTIASSTAGTPALIPTSYFTLTTTANLTNNQGGNNGTTTTQGLQNQLVTIKNATFSSATGTPLDPGATFASGTTYNLTDSTGTSKVYIYSSMINPNDLVGKTIPTGAVTVSGVDSQFNNAPEIEPRGTFDIPAAIPEPGTNSVCALGAGIGALLSLRRRFAGRV